MCASTNYHTLLAVTDEQNSPINEFRSFVLRDCAYRRVSVCDLSVKLVRNDCRGGSMNADNTVADTKLRCSIYTHQN